MPPQNYDSDSEQEVIAPRGKKRQPVSDVEMDDEEEVEEQEEQEEEEDEGEGEDEYVVEAIKKHRFDPAVSTPTTTLVVYMASHASMHACSH